MRHAAQESRVHGSFGRRSDGAHKDGTYAHGAVGPRGNHATRPGHLTTVTSMEQILDDSLTQSRMQTGVVGVRMAPGARAGDVLRLVLSGALWLTGAGLAAGAAVALALTRALAGSLFG